MMYFILLLVPVMTFIGAFASYFFKLAAGDLRFPDILLNLKLYLGVVLYVVAAGINIFVLKFLDYSVVLPLTSLTYVWTMIISSRLLGEKVGKKKIIGVALILFGTIIIAFF